MKKTIIAASLLLLSSGAMAEISEADMNKCNSVEELAEAVMTGR